MQIIEIADLQESEHQPFTWFEGEQFGSGVSLVIISSDQPGVGPYLHQHPYWETFVIRAGRALFTLGGEQITGAGGQIIVVPALTPHKFAVIGPDRLEMIDIHASEKFITEWLEGPRAVG